MYAASDEITLANCDMSMNHAGASGGGLYVPDLVIVNLSDSTLCMNTPDQFDYLGALLTTNVFGCDTTCPRVCPGDLTGDGTVDVDDLNIVLGNWGSDCP